VPQDDDDAQSLSGRTAVAVFAHPDDESLACGGTLSRLSDLGVRVVLICVSRGERGSIADPALVPNGDLGAVRGEELRRAAQVLGVAPADVVLFDEPDGDLRWAHYPQFDQQLARTIDAYSPDLVITFAEDGLYWHRDHIGVHERTYDAVASLGPRTPALYYVTIPHGVMRRIVDAAVQRGWAAQDASVFGITPDAFGLLAKPPTLTVDVRDWVARKLAALRCHRTQLGPTNPLAWIEQADAERWLGVELFRREAIGSSQPLLERIGEPVRCPEP
jgi:N-acetyl-1-D-myo-inositol-2-amino-2-deoxy-alpha-D-glucopyranoside deacetylase